MNISIFETLSNHRKRNKRTENTRKGNYIGEGKNIGKYFHKKLQVSVFIKEQSIGFKRKNSFKNRIYIRQKSICVNKVFAKIA